MYCVIKCIMRGNQVCVKNSDLRHTSCTVVKTRIFVTRPQCVNKKSVISGTFCLWVKAHNKILHQWSKYKIQGPLWAEDTKAPNSLTFQKQNWKNMTEEDNVQCSSSTTSNVITTN